MVVVMISATKIALRLSFGKEKNDKYFVSYTWKDAGLGILNDYTVIKLYNEHQSFSFTGMLSP